MERPNIKDFYCGAEQDGIEPKCIKQCKDCVNPKLNAELLNKLKYSYFIEETETGLWIPTLGKTLTKNPELAYKSFDKDKMVTYMALENLKGFTVTEHEFVY